MKRISLFRRAKRDALSCQKAVALVGDYLDGGLSDDLRLRLEQHLAECPRCAEYVAELRLTIAASGQVTPEPLSSETRKSLIDLYRRTIVD